MGPYSFVEQVKRGINHTGGKGKKKEAEKKEKELLDPSINPALA